jgi:hypothetical protein
MKLCVFFHGLLFLGNPPELLVNAVDIIRDQMRQLKESGLLDAANEFHVGLNGGIETGEIANLLFPPKARITLHSLQCRNELRTLRLLEQWLPGHEGWFVFWFHAKGSCHPPGDPLRTAWRECSMRHLVRDWRQCVADLHHGYDAVGTHWMYPPATPPGQYIFAGNFWYARASFLKTLPSIMERARIKESGIDALESRYEAEVFLCNGPRLPTVKDYCPGWSPGRSHV